MTVDKVLQILEHSSTIGTPDRGPTLDVGLSRARLLDGGETLDVSGTLLYALGAGVPEAVDPAPSTPKETAYHPNDMAYQQYRTWRRQQLAARGELSSSR